MMEIKRFEWLKLPPWILFFVLLGASCSFPWLLGPERGAPWTLPLGVSAILLFAIALGRSVGNSLIRFLIDGRNLVSLSRLQMCLWSMIGFGALIAAASCRFWHNDAILEFQFPGELVAAMGISYASAAASSAVLYVKSRGTDDGAISPDGRSEIGLVANGQIIARAVQRPPYLRDLVMGDDVNNAGSIDLSKVQQLILTMILVTTYFIMAWQSLERQEIYGNSGKLPGMGGGFLEFMLMSHGAYLAYKAVSKPSSGSQADDDQNPPDRNTGLGL